MECFLKDFYTEQVISKKQAKNKSQEFPKASEKTLKTIGAYRRKESYSYPERPKKIMVSTS